MTTIILEVPSEADVAELRRRPGYRVVGVVQPEALTAEEVEKPRVLRDWTTMLSAEEAALLRQHTEEARNEWERDF